MTWTFKKGTYEVLQDIVVGDKELSSRTIERGLRSGFIRVTWPEEREEGEESNGSGSEAS